MHRHRMPYYYYILYLYLFIEEMEQVVHTALAHTRQWCCRFIVVKVMKQTWHCYCFLYDYLPIIFTFAILRLYTLRLPPPPPSIDSDILNEPVREVTLLLILLSLNLPSISFINIINIIIHIWYCMVLSGIQ